MPNVPAPGKRAAHLTKDSMIYLCEKLRLSGLSASDAKRLGMRYCSAPPPGLPYAGSGIIIPYYDAQGKATGLFRYRYETDPRPKLARLTSRRPLRYAQPTGTAPEVYMPRLLDWANILNNSALPLIITEGELKAACGCVHAPHPAVGLGGVWSWQAKRQGRAVLPWFEEVAWGGRAVYIVFDSDVAINPEVLRAEVHLAKQLLAFGAVPLLVRIPPCADNEKQGLDDYIVNHGAAAFAAILEIATEYQSSVELHALNSEIAYVQNPGLIYRLDTGQRIACSDFVAHAYAHRKYIEMQPGKNGEYRAVEKKLPKVWIEWPSRFTVPHVDYAPGQPLVIPHTGNALNTWPGWACEPTVGDCTLWCELLDFLFAEAPPADRVWFERWLAYPLQCPGTKLCTAAVMWGLSHGTGKSLVGYTMFKIYGKNAVEIDERNLKEAYNEWAENKQFAMGEEITGGDKRMLADTIKHMITAQTMRVNPKYIPSYVVTNRINYYFTSNHCDAFFLEDDDRRLFIHEVIGTPLPDEFYARYDKWLRSGDAARAVFARLLNLDLGDFNPNARAPYTGSKQDMLRTGRSDVGEWVATLRADPDSVLRVGSVVLPYIYWRNQDLLALYDPRGVGRLTPNGMGRELRRAGFRQAAGGRPVRTAEHGQARVWMIRSLSGTRRQQMAADTQAAVGKQYDDERNKFSSARPKSLKNN